MSWQSGQVTAPERVVFPQNLQSRHRIEPEFLCAMTMKVMCDPVIDPTSPENTCERAALEEHLAESGCSPFTGSAPTFPRDAMVAPTAHL